MVLGDPCQRVMTHRLRTTVTEEPHVYTTLALKHTATEMNLKNITPPFSLCVCNQVQTLIESHLQS